MVAVTLYNRSGRIDSVEWWPSYYLAEVCGCRWENAGKGTFAMGDRR